MLKYAYILIHMKRPSPIPIIDFIMEKFISGHDLRLAELAHISFYVCGKRFLLNRACECQVSFYFVRLRDEIRPNSKLWRPLRKEKLLCALRIVKK